MEKPGGSKAGPTSKRLDRVLSWAVLIQVVFLSETLDFRIYLLLTYIALMSIYIFISTETKMSQKSN